MTMYNNGNDIKQYEQYGHRRPWQYSEEDEAWDRVAESLKPTLRK